MSKVPKDYAEVERLASRVAEKAKFPLKNFGDIASALGGEDAEVEYQGKGQKLGQVRKLIPDGFFPVESREDLIVKMAYLQTRGRKPEDDHTPGEQKKEAKADAGEPPKSPHIGKGRPGGLPALSGVKKEQG
jgi:hypothetical protein